MALVFMINGNDIDDIYATFGTYMVYISISAKQETVLARGVINNQFFPKFKKCKSSYGDRMQRRLLVPIMVKIAQAKDR